MLQKLRSRHAIDLPYGKWGRTKPLLAVLAPIALLFVLAPLGLSLLASASESVVRVAILVGAGFGTLALVLLVGGLRGKPGWQR